MVIIKKEEWVNAKHVEDFLATDGTVVPDFSGRTYLHPYVIDSRSQLNQLVAQSKSHKKKLQELKKKLKLKHITCRFLIKDFKLSSAEQVMLLDFQKEIFDDVTVQLFNGDLIGFNVCLEKASKSAKELCCQLDIKDNLRLIQEAHKTLQDFPVKYIKYTYGKVLPTHLTKYAEAVSFCTKNNMPRVLIGCNKRCGIDGFSNVSVTMLAIAKLGFAATCLHDIYPEVSSGRHKPTADYFNTDTWEFNRIDLDLYPFDLPDNVASGKAIRLKNLLDIEQELRENYSNKASRIQNFLSLSRRLSAQGL